MPSGSNKTSKNYRHSGAKKRRPARRRRRHGGLKAALFLVSFFLIAALLLWRTGGTGQLPMSPPDSSAVSSNDAVQTQPPVSSLDKTPSSTTAEEPGQSASFSSGNVSSSEATSDPLLTLVNAAHPLPADWQVDLVECQNGLQIDSRAAASLEAMLNDAWAAGLDPIVCSAYRSQELQTQLFENKVAYYLGLGYGQQEAQEQAGYWVAPPGTSEHQMGLAVDVVSLSNQNLDSSQENTPTQQWLMAHCWEYGFILRYPSDKSAITGIGYEPWHYRYVGQPAAEEITRLGVCLEEYLNQTN